FPLLTSPEKISGTANPNGAPAVPFPDNVALWFTWEIPAVVCTDPFGNLIPPEVVSICPATVNAEVGVCVPIPIRPLKSSVITESTRKSPPPNFGICPADPKPLRLIGDDPLLATPLPIRAPATLVPGAEEAVNSPPLSDSSTPMAP